MPAAEFNADDECRANRFSSSLGQRRLIWLQVHPGVKKYFGYAFHAGRQRALQHLDALGELRRIAIAGLPCLVENANKSRDAARLSAQATRRVLQLRWCRMFQVAETDERDVFRFQ
jgi:hypothetical protein